MIRIYIGPSAAGKDYMYRKYLKDMNGKVSPVISYTSRPMRDKETDGVDYNFVSKKVFEGMISDGTKLAEWRKYDTVENGQPATWYYGSPKLDVKDDYVAVLTPDGAKSYIDIYGKENIEVFYVTADESVRTMRAKRRGGFEQGEWERRLKTDASDFSDEVIEDLKSLLGDGFKTIINN